MARPLRLEWAGGWYHLSGRGNERRDVFRDDADRRRFLDLLGKLEERYGVEIHAYVLMNNHYHLLVRLKRESGLSAAMQWLGVSYTIWFNRRHRRSGHLFQGRFKAILVDFDQWGSALSRYIHLNPVRLRCYGLGKAERAADRYGLGKIPSREVIAARRRALAAHSWSSYRPYCGTIKGPPWLHEDEVLGCFGRKRPRQAYRHYVEEAIAVERSASPWDEVTGGFVLGGKELVKKVGQWLKADPREQAGLKCFKDTASLERVVALVARYRGEPAEAFINRHGDWGRDMVFLLARANSALTNRQLADWAGGIDDSAVSRAVSRLQARISRDPSLKGVLTRLQRKLSHVKT